MTLGRAADQAIGQELQMLLAKNAAYALAAPGPQYHVARAPASANEGQWGLIAGLPVASDALTAPGKFLHLIIDITAITATGTIVVTIYGVDPISGKIYVILASAVLGAVSTTILKVGPGLTAAANLVANDIVPISWGVGVLVATAGPMTFSLGALFMP